MFNSSWRAGSDSQTLQASLRDAHFPIIGNRGLKPTAKFVASLREAEAYSTKIQVAKKEHSPTAIIAVSLREAEAKAGRPRITRITQIGSMGRMGKIGLMGQSDNVSRIPRLFWMALRGPWISPI